MHGAKVAHARMLAASFDAGPAVEAAVLKEPAAR